MRQRSAIVIDIGKTMAKASLWSAGGALIEARSRANARCNGVLDAHGIEAWLADTLTEFGRLANVGAVIPVAHGAAAALIADGRLIAQPLDYEAPIAADVRMAYDQHRAPFGETGSPLLPNGLNLGMQLFCHDPLPNGAQILPWPQYWSWHLSGVASTEVTSLGCHTDLWNPSAAAYSSLAHHMGWVKHFPPLCHAGDVLGPITPAWAAHTGLPVDTQIYCGIHDSNAARIAAQGFTEIAGREATILSTGTWFVAMRTPTERVDLTALPQGRDCLVNVDAEGQPVPSARFMGGREIDLLGSRIDQPEIDGVCEVISGNVMILPTFAPGCGPFPQGKGRWLNEPADAKLRSAAIALYAALVVDTMLTLIGARNILLIEGRFAAAVIFVRALARLRPDLAVYTSATDADVSFGALRLINPALKPKGAPKRVAPLANNLADYQAEWHRNISKGSAT